MGKIGFHASHELYSPAQLLRLVKLAQSWGFSAGSCSDHFSPWSETGESGYAWSWLAAALEGTNLDFGTVCSPGQRYHPAIIAQAAATLSEMYPGRFWLALGTGQNLNEHITGQKWPEKKERQQRLLECVDIIRRLWRGETVSHSGLVTVQDAKLYTRPKVPPLIFGAAITDTTAEWVGSWADGLITVAKSKEDLAATVEAFRRGGGQNKPMRLQAAVSFEKSEKVAEVAAYHNWGIGALQIDQLQDIASPALFDRLVDSHQPVELVNSLRISNDIDQHVEWIATDFSLGFEAVYLHFIGNNIEQFFREISPYIATHAM